MCCASKGCAGKDLMSGIYANQVGLVAVAGIQVLPVVVPLLQGAGCANLVRSQAGQHGIGLLYKGSVSHEQGGFPGILEAFPDDGYIGRGSVGGAAHIAGRRFEEVLRGSGRGSDEFPVFLRKDCHAELGCAFQHRIVAFQGFPVAGKEPVLIDVRGQPGPAQVPVGPGGVSGS